MVNVYCSQIGMQMIEYLYVLRKSSHIQHAGGSFHPFVYFLLQYE